MAHQSATEGKEGRGGGREGGKREWKEGSEEKKGREVKGGWEKGREGGERKREQSRKIRVNLILIFVHSPPIKRKALLVFSIQMHLITHFY